ncbi:MAG TPA: PilZ domain-containing protein [Bradyrhizobium sp.]|nr:PilZ domain-containing protein [Bradyrhizobium sp.]
MLDGRQSVRDKVLYGGVAAINEHGSTMDCVVRNISEGGACVQFGAAETAKLPDQMNLTIARKGRSFLARMIWRQADKVGLAFRVMTASGAPADLDQRLRRSEQKKRQLQRRIRELLGDG